MTTHPSSQQKREALKVQILEMITPGSAWKYDGDMQQGLKVCDYTANKILDMFEQEIAEARADELQSFWQQMMSEVTIGGNNYHNAMSYRLEKRLDALRTKPAPNTEVPKEIPVKAHIVSISNNKVPEIADDLDIDVEGREHE